MTAITLRRILVAVFMLAALIAIPTHAAAQTSQTAFDILLTDPCTGGNTVHVTGLETTTITSKVTGSGDLHLDVSDVFKGSGVDVLDSTKTYSYSDNQQFSFTAALPLDPNGTTDSSFTAKIFLKGSKALDNWMIKATIVIKINANGIITKNTMLTSDVCKG